jgi:hypothetical protein
MLTVAAVAAPFFYATAHLQRLGDLSTREPSLLLMALAKTVGFAVPSATMQTVVGFLAALFVSSFLRGNRPTGYRATLALDLFLVLPYLLPSIAWFWFTADRGITTLRWLGCGSDQCPEVLEHLAEALDMHLVAAAHLAPFTYLVVRLFFDHLRSEDIVVLVRQLGSRMKGLLVAGGRPMLALLAAIFVLRLLITANKYDLPYFGSKAYENIRTGSWIFTVPLWLDFVRGSGLGSSLSIAASLSLWMVLGLGVFSGGWLLARTRVDADSFDRRIGNLCGVVLFRLERSWTPTLGIGAAAAFVWMVGSSVFVSWSLLSRSSWQAFGQLWDLPPFRSGLLLSFVLIASLTSLSALLVPICRIVHVLSNGWGTALSFQVVGLFLVLPSLLVAIAWRPFTTVYRPLVYSSLLFVTAFPFLYLQVAAVWKRRSAGGLAAVLRSKSAFTLVLRHLLGGQLRDFAVTSYMVMYVVVVNEVACAELLLPDGMRPINYTFLRIKSMFDASDQVQATAPLVVVLLAICVLVPLYLLTRPRMENPAAR